LKFEARKFNALGIRLLSVSNIVILLVTSSVLFKRDNTHCDNTRCAVNDSKY